MSLNMLHSDPPIGAVHHSPPDLDLQLELSSSSLSTVVQAKTGKSCKLPQTQGIQCGADTEQPQKVLSCSVKGVDDGFHIPAVDCMGCL